jgi:endonuclease III
MAFVPTREDPPLQEIVRKEDHGAWRVAVVTLMLVATTRRQVETVYRRFFDAYPSPRDVIEAGRDRLEAELAATGLHRQKAHRIWYLSTMYQALCCASDATTEPEDFPIRVMPGCGEYVQHAWRIFVLCDFDFEPCDAVLVEWVRVVNERRPMGVLRGSRLT